MLDAIVSNNNANRVHAIAMWWDLDMDGSGKLILSTAPEWIDANAKVTYGWWSVDSYRGVRELHRNKRYLSLCF